MITSSFVKFSRTACLLTMVSAVALLPAASQAQEDARTAGKREVVRDTSETYKQLNLFGDVFERVRAQYVEEVEDKQLVESAINGMLMALDPHSSYLNEDGFKDMQIQTKGEFGGLGIEVTMENGVIKVVSPIDETPAFRAGVQAGDYISHLDDEQIIGLSLNEAVDKMRGKVGTPIKLTIRREKVAEPIELTIIRDIIKIRSVRSEVIQDNIGYVRITTFNQNTDQGVRDAVKTIKESVGKDQRLVGYILDMRNNPGGLLDQAIAVADDFLDKGEIVSTRGRHESDTKRDNATPGDIADGLPIVVLINGGSASASEIVAGALQDHRRAIVLGTKSFGKGSVQTVVPLPGHGAMRLTTARYYTPSGRSIQAKGIEPDIMVEPAKIEKLDSRGGYSEADLRGALSNPEGDSKIIIETKDKEADTSKKDEEAKDKTADDYQLARAVDLIRGVSLYEERLTPAATPAVKQDDAEAADSDEKSETEDQE